MSTPVIALLLCVVMFLFCLTASEDRSDVLYYATIFGFTAIIWIILGVAIS